MVILLRTLRKGSVNEYKKYMIKLNRKTETVGIRLSKKLRQEMDAVKEQFGLSLSNQFSIAIRTFHKTLSDDK